MTLHDVPVEAAVHAHRSLHVHLRPHLPGAEVGLQHCLVHGGDDVLFPLLVHLHHRQAAAVVRHALVDSQFITEGHFEGEVVVGILFLYLDDLGRRFNDAGKHDSFFSLYVTNITYRPSNYCFAAKHFHNPKKSSEEGGILPGTLNFVFRFLLFLSISNTHTSHCRTLVDELGLRGSLRV